MSSIKIERISSQIVKELSSVIFNDVKDNRIKSITITGADVSSDLGQAKIYYTFLGNYEKEEIDAELKKAAGFLRVKLSERIDLRHTPELKFIFDESIEYGTNIEKILADINK